MKNFFETTMRIDASKTDLQFRLSIAGMLEIMEDVQTLHTDDMKVDAPNLRKTDNAFWVITRNYIHVNRLPRWEENVVVGTYPLKPTALRSERQNYINDAEGNVLISGKTEWCALDCDTRKIRPVNTITCYPTYMEHKTNRILNSFPNIAPVEFGESNLAYSRIMRASDLDFNHHVNNVKYANFIVDCFPSEFWENNSFTDIKLDYINECKEGETLYMYALQKDNVLRFAGKTSDKTIFAAAIVLK